MSGRAGYTAHMLWIKAFHIVFIASWFAGLFYLPRIYVNLAMVPADSAAERARLLLMARKLYRFMTILAVPALVLGLVNTIVRPILVILTLPVTILTLGLFILLINAMLFWGVAEFIEGFGVDLHPLVPYTLISTAREPRQDDDLMPLGSQRGGQRPAQKPRSPGNDNFHSADPVD